LRRAKIVRVLLIMLHDKIPHVIGQRHTSLPRGSDEFRFDLLRHIKGYRHALTYRKSAVAANAV